MLPEQKAFLCGQAWLNERPGEAPTDNQLVDLCDDGSLEFAQSCVAVADACAWVAQWRALEREATQ